MPRVCNRGSINTIPPEYAMWVKHTHEQDWQKRKKKHYINLHNAHFFNVSRFFLSNENKYIKITWSLVGSLIPVFLLNLILTHLFHFRRHIVVVDALTSIRFLHVISIETNCSYRWKMYSDLIHRFRFRSCLPET